MQRAFPALGIPSCSYLPSCWCNMTSVFLAALVQDGCLSLLPFFRPSQSYMFYIFLRACRRRQRGETLWKIHDPRERLTLKSAFSQSSNPVQRRLSPTTISFRLSRWTSKTALVFKITDFFFVSQKYVELVWSVLLVTTCQIKKNHYILLHPSNHFPSYPSYSRLYSGSVSNNSFWKMTQTFAEVKLLLYFIFFFSDAKLFSGSQGELEPVLVPVHFRRMAYTLVVLPW